MGSSTFGNDWYFRILLIKPTKESRKSHHQWGIMLQFGKLKKLFMGESLHKNTFIDWICFVIYIYIYIYACAPANAHARPLVDTWLHLANYARGKDQLHARKQRGLNSRGAVDYNNAFTRYLMITDLDQWFDGKWAIIFLFYIFLF